MLTQVHHGVVAPVSGANADKFRQIKAGRWAIALAVVTAALLGTAGQSEAAFTDPQLLGTTQYDGWATDDLNTTGNSGYPSFPGTGAWPGPMESGTAGSGDAELYKISNGAGGGPFPSSGSLYYGGFAGDPNINGGTVAVTDSTPVSDLNNVVFQIEIGEAYGYDFFNNALPTLNYNGGDQAIAATTSALMDQYQNGTFPDPVSGEDEPVYVNTYMIQWDLSSITDSITEFEIAWTAVQHAQVYALQLDQSNTFTAVPEPASVGLVAVGCLLVVGRRTRRRS